MPAAHDAGGFTGSTFKLCSVVSETQEVWKPKKSEPEERDDLARSDSLLAELQQLTEEQSFLPFFYLLPFSIHPPGGASARAREDENFRYSVCNHQSNCMHTVEGS